MSFAYAEADRSVELREITVGGVLREAAAQAPAAVALVNGSADHTQRRRWTYAELLAAAEGVAGQLLRRMEPGERLAIWSVNRAEWELVQFGAALAGIPVMAINPAYTAAELEYVVGQSGSVAIVLGPEFRGVDPTTELAKVRDRLPALRDTFTLAPDSPLFAGPTGTALPDVNPASLAMMQYTSGTTGRPKGAMLSHRSLCNNARLFNRRLGLAGGGSWLNAMPMFHIGGSSFGAIGSMWSRAAHIITVFDPALMLELIETERPVFLPTVPTMLMAMVEHPDFLRRDHSSVQVVMAGSTTIPAELIRRVEKEWGANFVPCYGQTECSGVIVQGMPEDTPEDKSAWAGRPLEQVEVRVVDPTTGEVVPHGDVGELQVRGYTTMSGYFAMPEETAATLDAEGWLHTGDLGVMDPRGYLQVTGRLKDMIIRGGENIYPREIEDRLIEHPAISEVAVIGLPDARLGEDVVAVVRPAPDAALDPDAWREFARATLAPAKVPRRWFVVDAMPTNPSGKIQKFRLPELIETGLARQVHSAVLVPASIGTRCDGELVLVRHGRVEVESSGVLRHDPGLSAAGHFQARSTAAVLAGQNITAVYSSPQQRALQTARPVAEALGLRVQVEPALAEFDRNATEYVGFDELRERGDPRYHACLGGDLSAWGVDAATFRSEVVRAVLGIAGTHPGERVVLVTHGGVLNALLGSVLGLDRLWFFRPENGGICRVAVDPGLRMRITSLNECGHLSA